MTAATGVLEHAIGATGAFALNVRSNDVRVVAVDGDTVRIRARDGLDLTRFDTERGPGLLSVRAGGGVDELDVEVPHHATVVIEGSSGDIIVRGLRAEQHYRTSSGDIQLDGVGGRLSAEAVSGDVRIIASDRVEVSARTVSGDATLAPAGGGLGRVRQCGVDVAGRAGRGIPFVARPEAQRADQCLDPRPDGGIADAQLALHVAEVAAAAEEALENDELLARQAPEAADAEVALEGRPATAAVQTGDGELVRADGASGDHVVWHERIYSNVAFPLSIPSFTLLFLAHLTCSERA